MLIMRPRILLLLALLPLAACDDGLGPRTWINLPDTVTIYSLSRPELLGMPSAVDLVSSCAGRCIAIPINIESPGASGRWDIALGEENGQPVFLPSGVFQGFDDRVGLGLLEETNFDNVNRVPSDANLFNTGVVPIQLGRIYAVRTRREACGFSSGVRYGKLQPLAYDAVAGSLQLRVVVNPYCNDRNLVPEDD